MAYLLYFAGLNDRRKPTEKVMNKVTLPFRYCLIDPLTPSVGYVPTYVMTCTFRDVGFSVVVQ